MMANEMLCSVQLVQGKITASGRGKHKCPGFFCKKDSAVDFFFFFLIDGGQLTDLLVRLGPLYHPGFIV